MNQTRESARGGKADQNVKAQDALKYTDAID